MKIAKSKNIEKLVIKANFMIQIWMCLFCLQHPVSPGARNPHRPLLSILPCVLLSQKGITPIFWFPIWYQATKKRFQDTNDMGKGVEIIFANCPIPVLPADVPI